MNEFVAPIATTNDRPKDRSFQCQREPRFAHIVYEILCNLGNIFMARSATS